MTKKHDKLSIGISRMVGKYTLAEKLLDDIFVVCCVVTLIWNLKYKNIRVETSVNDLVIVDNALNDSMLSPQIERKSNQENKRHAREDLSDHGNKKKDVTENKEGSNDSEMQEEIRTNDPVEDVIENEEVNVRKSTRIKKKRMVITEDEIGDCDDIDDPDYKINQRRQY